MEGAQWIDRIFVGSVESYALKCGRDPKKDVARAIELGHDLAYTINPGFSITDSYPGKSEKIAREKADFESAVFLKNGEIVEVESRQYTVKYMGLRYSDPIKFIPVKGV